MKDDLRWFFDVWNTLGAIGVTAISILAFLFGGYTPQSVLVAVTALYAFITFNQMRESRFKPRTSHSLAVRPHFQQDGKGDGCDFGLKNFGDGPALNLRVKAILRSGGDIVDELTISSRERHLHLEEGQFLSLVSEASNQQSFGDLTDGQDAVFEEYEQKTIELYYTFESSDGTQYPLEWSNSTDLEMEAVVAKAESPRTVELAEIYEKCSRPANHQAQLV